MTEISHILSDTVKTLKGVQGLQAIVLGGSRGTGTDQEGSDIDIGLYYEEPLDRDALQLAAQKLDDEHRPNLVAAPGGWGNWVNGGGWLIVEGIHLDLILRETKRVRQAVVECEEGQISSHYQPGHPHAFTNVMYRGELATCKMLWSITDDLPALKRQAEIYPPLLKNALINFFGFEAAFSQDLAKKYVDKDDIYYVTAHLIRSISALNQVIFALNQKYCLNEKKAVLNIQSFPLRPNKYKERVDKILTKFGDSMQVACELLSDLIAETRKLYE